MPTYPATLPNPSINMSGNVTRPKIGTQLIGRRRSRRRFTGKQSQFNVQFEFSADELAAFETFVDTDLKGGSLYFDIDLPIHGPVATHSMRFLNEQYGEAYRVHNHWRINAILEEEVAQGVNDPDQAFNPVYFQPEFVITEDTVIGEQHRNALLRVQGVTVGTPIVLKTLFADEAAEYIPFGVQHEGGQGDVIVRMLEDGDDGSVTDPFTLATQLGIHIYSFADPSYYTADPGGGIDILHDQNGNDTLDVESLRATDDSRKAAVSGTSLQVRVTGNKTFESFAPSEGLNGKGCFIVVADVATGGSRTLIALGPSNDRPRYMYTVDTGSYNFVWGAGGDQSHSGSGAPNTQSRKAVYMFYVPTGTATPKAWIDGQSLGMGTNEGTFPTAFFDATIFGKDDVNESVGADIDLYEAYIANIGTGDTAAGLTEAQFLELAEAICDAHGVTWLGT
jgi:hypothetical protein